MIFKVPSNPTFSVVVWFCMSRVVITWGNTRAHPASGMMGTKGSNCFAHPQLWQKSLGFPPEETGCWVLLGLGSGLSPSSKAEPRAVVVRGSFQTLLTSTANPARSICNWKHNSHHSVFFTWAFCLHHCRVHRHIFIFFLVFPLSSSWVILGQACNICETSKAHGCAEVPQKVLTLWGFHGYCILSLAVDSGKWWLCFHQVWLELALDSCW